MFGQQAFGQQKPANTVSFGQQPQQTGFGVQPQFGGFGQQQPIGQQPVVQQGFGLQQPQQGFGATFGQQQQPQQTGFGGFNQQPQQVMSSPTIGSFGQQNAFNKPAFGQPQTTFGQPQQIQQTTFGQPQQNAFAPQPFGAQNAPFNTQNVPQQAAQTIPTTAVPTCVACNANFYVAGLASGELKIVTKNPQSTNQTNVGSPIIGLDICQDEAAIATTQGILLMHLTTGQSRKITSYNLPVPCIKYINKDYLLASFIAVDNNSIPLKQKIKTENQTTTSRWATPATQTQNQDALMYEIQIIDLTNGTPVTSTKPVACSGLFTFSKDAQSNSYTSSYNSNLCKIYIPGIYNYESNAIYTYLVKKQSNTVKAESSTSSSFPSGMNPSGISAIAVNTTATKVLIGYENGDLASISLNSQSSTYSRYNNATSSSNLQKVNCRINCLYFSAFTNEFLAGLQNGMFASIKDDGAPNVTIRQIQDEISAIATIDQEMIIGVGSMQKVLDCKTGQLMMIRMNVNAGKLVQ